MGLTRYPEPKLQHADGSLWEASCRDDEADLHWITLGLIAVLHPERRLFFRQLARNPAHRWWLPWRPKWLRTGKTWEGGNMDDGGFVVLRHTLPPETRRRLAALDEMKAAIQDFRRGLAANADTLPPSPR